jgi:hypothetical protein
VDGGSRHRLAEPFEQVLGVGGRPRPRLHGDTVRALVAVGHRRELLQKKRFDHDLDRCGEPACGDLSEDLHRLGESPPGRDHGLEVGVSEASPRVEGGSARKGGPPGERDPHLGFAYEVQERRHEGCGGSSPREQRDLGGIDEGVGVRNGAGEIGLEPYRPLHARIQRPLH